MSIAPPETLPPPLLDAEQVNTQIHSEAPTSPPTDLYSNEPPLETSLHLRQMILLLTCLDWLWRDRNDFFAAGNLTIYYSLRQSKSEDFRGPDFFMVLDTERKPRKSWTVWEEDGKYPNVIIELLSESTTKTDQGIKKQIYQDTFRLPEYFWFSPHSLEFAGFALVQNQYQPMQLDERGWYWSQQLQLFLGIQDSKLRFFTPEGELVPTPEEAAQQEQQQRLAAEEAAQQEQQQRLAAEEAAQQEQQQRLAAEEAAQQEQQQRLAVEEAAQQEQQQRLAAEQRAAEAEALLAQYRARFGEIG